MVSSAVQQAVRPVKEHYDIRYKNGFIFTIQNDRVNSLNGLNYSKPVELVERTETEE